MWLQCITSRKGRIVHLGGQWIASAGGKAKQRHRNVLNWPATRRATTSLFRLVLDGSSKWNDLAESLSFSRTCLRRVERPGFAVGPSLPGAPRRFASLWLGSLGLNSSAESFDIELPSSLEQNFQSRLNRAYRPVGHKRSFAEVLNGKFD